MRRNNNTGKNTLLGSFLLFKIFKLKMLLKLNSKMWLWTISKDEEVTSNMTQATMKKGKRMNVNFISFVGQAFCLSYSIQFFSSCMKGMTYLSLSCMWRQWSWIREFFQVRIAGKWKRLVLKLCCSDSVALFTIMCSAIFLSWRERYCVSSNNFTRWSCADRSS